MLSRLMPPALSEEGQRSIDAMLDELCGEEEIIAPEQKMPRWKIFVPVGIAAAAAIAFAVPALLPVEKQASPAIAAARPAPSAPEIELVGQTDRIEKAVDEGLVADFRGRTLQAVRVRAVKENTFRDGSTGIIFHVSRPREELVLSPVNEF